MKRKHFITSIITSAVSLKLMGANMGQASNPKTLATRVPTYLRPGDSVGITSPAGYISLQEIEPAIKKLQEWGFDVVIGDSIGKRDHTFGGTDEERLFDMQQMLDSKKLSAIMCARGGYGIVRIIDDLNFKKFHSHPKWLIGFSDITVMHNHIHTNLNIATIHSKMCNSFPENWSLAEQIQRDTIDSIRHCLMGERMHYQPVPHPANRQGKGKGQLIGGNLKTLESIAGSKSDLVTKNKILFVEDTGEYLYSIDRMFWNLKRSGKLKALQGLIIGGFKTKKDDAGEEFGLSLQQIVLEKIQGCKYPVCFDFPVGHQKNNYALRCGMMHTLTVAESDVSLTSIP